MSDPAEYIYIQNRFESFGSHQADDQTAATSLDEVEIVWPRETASQGRYYRGTLVGSDDIVVAHVNHNRLEPANSSIKKKKRTIPLPVHLKCTAIKLHTTSATLC